MIIPFFIALQPKLLYLAKCCIDKMSLIQQSENTIIMETEQSTDHIKGRWPVLRSLCGRDDERTGWEIDNSTVPEDKSSPIIGFFNCHGGVSRPPYASLNVGFHVGDDENNVTQNRLRVKELLGVKHLLSAKQVHGLSIYQLKDGIDADCEVSEPDGYDALITAEKGVGLMIQHADCQAVLLCDPVNRVIAAVHNGWRGSVQNILRATVVSMEAGYGVVPQNVHAIIGPSLGPCCGQFIHYENELPHEFQKFMVKKDYFDFWATSKHQLMQCGLKETNVQSVSHCTVCSKDYFSYRRASQEQNGITGRNCSIIALP